jgi:iron complex transport system substrate-binding protein
LNGDALQSVNPPTADSAATPATRPAATPGTHPPAIPDRIASLIPAATEIVCALGLGDRLVLRSHECDEPPGVERIPFATEPKYEPDGTSYAIDERVRALVQEGLSVYRVDADCLREARPEVIVTQHQCEVCAVSAREVEAAACAVLDPPPRIISLDPGGLGDVLGDIQRVAAGLGVPERGRELTASLRRRMDEVRARVEGRPRPRTITIEWLDPLMVAGNWIPELVDMAGGENLLGRAGEHSPFVSWDEIRATEPEAIVVIPCGFTIARTRREIGLLTGLPGWAELPAVKKGVVAIADGHHFFNRPGPRIVESLEILAEILHPKVAAWGHRGVGWDALEV